MYEPIAAGSVLTQQRTVASVRISPVAFVTLFTMLSLENTIATGGAIWSAFRNSSSTVEYGFAVLIAIHNLITAEGAIIAAELRMISGITSGRITCLSQARLSDVITTYLFLAFVVTAIT